MDVYELIIRANLSCGASLQTSGWFQFPEYLLSFYAQQRSAQKEGSSCLPCRRPDGKEYYYQYYEWCLSLDVA